MVWRMGRIVFLLPSVVESAGHAQCLMCLHQYVTLSCVLT